MILEVALTIVNIMQKSRSERQGQKANMRQRHTVTTTRDKLGQYVDDIIKDHDRIVGGSKVRKTSNAEFIMCTRGQRLRDEAEGVAEDTEAGL